MPSMNEPGTNEHFGGSRAIANCQQSGSASNQHARAQRGVVGINEITEQRVGAP
jgi:hypothetical protein